MTTTIDLGVEGPHPDLLAQAVASINQYMMPEEDVTFHVDDFQVLQQRTVYGVTWTNLWEQSPDFGSDTMVDVSVCLAVGSAIDGRTHLALCQAHRLPDREWGVAELSSRWQEDPPEHKFDAFGNQTRGLGMAFGGVAHVPEVALGRITLPDGEAAESPVSNGSFLVLMPFSAKVRWGSSATVSILDSQGDEIVSQLHDFVAMAR